MAAATKTTTPKTSAFTVNFQLSGEVSIELNAQSLDDALEQARGFSFKDVVTSDFDELDTNKSEVTGLFRIF